MQASKTQKVIETLSMHLDEPTRYQQDTARLERTYMDGLQLETLFLHSADNVAIMDFGPPALCHMHRSSSPESSLAMPSYPRSWSNSHQDMRASWRPPKMSESPKS
jgi:hypothetical protein